MYKVLVIIVAIVAAGIIPVSTSFVQTYAQQEIASIAGGFASITTEQSGDKIVITIVREPGSAPTDGNVTLPEVPEGPIIIVPDPGGEGNGTVIVPQPPASNETATGNETAPTPEPPVIIVDPGNNDTIVVEPPTNVTQVDNGTVIIHPPAQNVTETPGNVTVVDPPVGNTTEPAPEPCGCPPAAGGISGAPPDIQLPTGNETNNSNITIVEEGPPVPTQLPADQQTEESNDNGDGNNNEDGGGG